MTAFALRADGWYLRSDIVWSKSNPMPESVTDRPTKSHEYIFLLSKSPRYYFDQESVKEATVRAGDVQTFGGAKARDGQEQGGDPRNGHRADANSQWGKAIQTKATRNIRSVWTIATQPFSEAHFATFPPELIKPCILAGSPAGGVVLDPFCGSATTGVVATQWNRDFIGIELNPEYVEMGRRRIEGQNGKMALYQLIEAKERQGALLDG
jgi:DNA modification methylase